MNATEAETIIHDLHPVQVGPSPYIGHAQLYRQGCTCGWRSKWYVYRKNAEKSAQNHQTVNQ